MHKKAVIFDMDGVISDTQKYHAEVESLLLQKHGIFMSPSEITETYAGVSDEEMFQEIFTDHSVDVYDMHSLLKQKWQLMEEVSQGRLTAIAYARELIETLRVNNFRLAVASASTKHFIAYVLSSLNLTKSFEIIASAEEVEKGKPAPDLFLLVAKKLSLSPREIVVIEDGRSGMVAAEAAGMKSIGLVSDTTKTYPATILVKSLAEVTSEVIQNL